MPRAAAQKIRGRKPPGFGKAPRHLESRPEHRERPDRAHQGGATRHAREARCRPKPRHTDRCQATTATGCRKPGQRAQHATNHGTGTGARQHPTHTPMPHPPARSGGVQARTQTHTHPNTPARSGRAQLKPEPEHTHPHRPAQPGVAGYKRSGHTGAHIPQDPSQERLGAAETRAQAHTPTPHTPARSGGVQAELAHKHTHTPQHPSQEWRSAAETRARTHTHTPHTPARSGGEQAEQADKHTHTPTPQLGEAGRSRNPRPSRHTHAEHPSQEWRGTSGAGTGTHIHPNTRARSGRAQPKPEPKHTPTLHIPARSGGVQAERAHKHTHTPTPQPGVVGRSRNPSPSTHTDTTHPDQEWQGTSGAGARARTHLNTPARGGGAQPKPEPKHTHPPRTPQPGVVGNKWSRHTNRHTPQHPSHEWRGTAEIQAQAHSPTPQTPARSGGVQAEGAQEHKHTPTAQPGEAGRSRNPSPNTHTHTTHPSQDWRGTSKAGTRADTHPKSPPRRGGAQPKPKPQHTHPRRTPQPGVTGYKRRGCTSTHTPQHPSQEWRGAAEAQAKAHTPEPHTLARSGGVQAERAQEHAHTPTPQPGVAGRS